MTRGLTLAQIAERLPLEQGDVVWVTANLTRLAFSLRRTEGEFYPQMVIDMLKSKVGEKGSIVVPAFNHDLRRKDNFDIRTTRPVTGALAIALMGSVDFIRTQHPLHSFLVTGRLAEKLASLDNESSFGMDSPFGLLLEEGAKFLLIGTKVADAFTFVHFVEEEQRVRYRKFRAYNILYSDRFGNTSRKRFRLYAKKAGYDMCLDKLETLFREKGILWEEELNGTGFTVAGLPDAYSIISDDIQNNRARNIAYFSTNQYIRGKGKTFLKQAFNYQTVTDRIRS